MGYRAARALRKLDRGDELIAWRDRLEGTHRDADLSYELGLFHGRHRELDQADAAFRHAAERYAAVGDYRKTFNSLREVIRTNWRASRFRPAIEHARRAFDVAEAMDDDARRAEATQMMGSLFHEVGDLGSRRWALAETRRYADPGDKQLAAQIYEAEGHLEVASGRMAMATRAFERALELATELKSQNQIRSHRLNLTKSYIEMGDAETAAEHLSAAREALPQDQTDNVATHYYRAQVAAARERYDEAVVQLEAALGRPEISDDWRVYAHYQLGLAREALNDIESARAAYGEAIAIVERMHQEVRVDRLRSWILSQKRLPYDALVTLEISAGRSMAAFEVAGRARALSALGEWAAPPSSDTPPSTIDEATSSALTLIDTLQILGSHTPRSFHPVEHFDGNSHTSIYFYFRGRDRWHLFVIDGDGLRIHDLGDDPQRLLREIRHFTSHPGDVRAAASLGRSLFPEGTLPETGRRMEIVTDSDLDDVPFAALRPENRFLIEDHVVSRLAAVAPQRSKRPARHRTGVVVALGDPRGDLRAARSEADRVARRFGTEAFLGDEASWEIMLGSRDAELLHLAAHAGLEDRGTWVQLADRVVGPADIIENEIAPQVVVLSGCATGVGDERGFAGSLARAFHVAGSEWVVGTLWSIGDDVATEFVLSLYDGPVIDDPPLSLAEAQRRWIEDRRPAEHWATFHVTRWGTSPNHGGSF